MLEHGKPLEDGKPSAGADDGEDDNRGSESKPKRFNDLAEKLGVELDELYALEVASGADGKAVTVQELKDLHATRSDFRVSQLKWEEERSRQNSELVRGNADLRELLAAIPRDKLDANVLEKVRTKVQANADRERARTLEVIPDWRNQETHVKELTEIGTWLHGNYGFPPDYLKTVYDHRALLMMREAWRREERVKAALAEIEKDPPAAIGKSKASGKAPSKPGHGPIPRGRAGLAALLQD